jgi:hypothetical protein
VPYTDGGLACVVGGGVLEQAAHAKCGFEEVDRIVKFRKALV